jgi:dienelactone hydrolase
MKMEKISLTTSDGVKIIGNHFKAPKGSPGILLLHMMPAVKESYNKFAEELFNAGIGVLAIDFRGHGESEGGNYQEFSEQQHQASIEDVKAAIEFQKKEGHSQLFICGASIGANLALQIISESNDLDKAILLSAGINYKGIETEPLAEKVSVDKDIYLVAAKDDVRSGGSSDEQNRKILAALSCKKEIRIFETGGHGTDIFNVHPSFMHELVSWLKE